jgi:group I intron endonuclease
MGFIYKITNIITGKCYIGETTQPDPIQRWRKHIQCLKTNKGCPALKDAMKKYGVDNFTFQVIIICFDEDVHRLEREYIQKYNSMVPNGYNILEGGQGGAGFRGKKHSEETIQKIKQSIRKFQEDNPDHFETYREKHKESMKHVNISMALHHSEKFQQAKKEGRLGAKAHKHGTLSDETKKKIQQSVINYYQQNKIIRKKIY